MQNLRRLVCDFVLLFNVIYSCTIFTSKGAFNGFVPDPGRFSFLRNFWTVFSHYERYLPGSGLELITSVLLLKSEYWNR